MPGRFPHPCDDLQESYDTSVRKLKTLRLVVDDLNEERAQLEILDKLHCPEGGEYSLACQKHMDQLHALDMQIVEARRPMDEMQNDVNILRMLLDNCYYEYIHELVCRDTMPGATDAPDFDDPV